MRGARKSDRKKDRGFLDPENIIASIKGIIITNIIVVPFFHYAIILLVMIRLLPKPENGDDRQTDSRSNISQLRTTIFEIRSFKVIDAHKIAFAALG